MAKINYKQPNLRGLGSDHQLKPGINDVPDHVWAKWEDHPHVADLIEKGEIVVLASKTAKPAEGEGETAKRGRKPKADKVETTDPAAAEKAKIEAELQAALAAKANAETPAK